ncbi:unnamed protein product [Adineta steineri]|uniref:G-protein coupled receptors family 1 profile domain-containing protein n=1 Tax=Adineta steineri TaxID=433720 RepID=A0A819TK30_9BILA|nr:unnamed protein product [Adineta steineri]CAF1194328.1 unnamed protein product [Adineta steineri]CAF4078644.1 unnamed protein product [Adineta steineri]CAF4152512.1 unnamed protein product [Adineta steineri]
MTRYLLPTILALGNLGNLFTIAIYTQKNHRKNSCSIYLIGVSCFSLLGSNWAIAPAVYALDNFDMINRSTVLCRIRGYIIHTSSMSFRYLLVLLCADRYALCNKRVFIRALSRPQIAYRSVAVTTVFWSVVSIHLLIWESIENGRCGVYGIYGQIFSFYVVIFTGFIPIVSMISFGILLGKSLKSLHAQIQPLNSCHRLNRRDISLIKLVLVEIIVYIICTALYPPMTVYTQITSSMASSKTAERKQIETFINFIIMSFLLYLNYNTTFYVHLITSKSFRNQVKDLILKCCGRPPRNVRNHQSGLKTMSKIPGRQLLQRTTNV